MEPIPEIDRLKSRVWAKVKIGGEDECWQWLGTNSYGYGVIEHHKVTYPVYRLIYMLENNIFNLKKYEVTHSCRKRGCCNPNHLILKKERISINFEVLEQRLWRSVRKGDIDSCWEWMKSCNRHGFGAMMFQGKTFLAHRLAYMFTNKVLVLTFEDRIFHTCKNNKCCNPKHLFLRVGIRGENNMSAKLNRLQVAEIRYSFFVEKISKSKLAKKYDVSVVEILYIIRRSRWGWLK